MKFKLSVLTLLVLGLVFAGSAFAADRLVVSLDAKNDLVYTVSDAAVLNGIPMLRMKITNEYSLTREVTAITLTAGTNTACTGGTFEVQIFQDVNTNGILDVGDSELAEAVASSMTAAGDAQAITLLPTLTISVNSSKWIFSLFEEPTPSFFA